MKKTLLTTLTLALLGTMGQALARGGYNDVPPGDAQYKQCIRYANSNYENGGESSPIPGQNKAEAYCECMWNETPDSFRGNLVKFAESDRGAKTNKICEKHSGWTNY
ncbi:MAG: Uncharacterized protein FD135_5188 [Comamonadaceae bacterium]|nr:MAG: Uncharacterized protein FD135_5188 [Comamonadaceae bacterium]